jgi:transcriptional regulator with XRE-family HTH domain
MGKTLREKMASLPAGRRARIEAETKKLVAEELSLRELRKAFALTQAELAESLGIGQDEVSRIERRADILVSTLRRFIASMGGELDLVARFPDRPPVRIARLEDLDEERARRRRVG